MAKIIRLEDGRKSVGKTREGSSCPHRRVVAWRAERVVRCEVCGATLDPFDVLVDLLQRSAPDDP